MALPDLSAVPSERLIAELDSRSDAIALAEAHPERPRLFQTNNGPHREWGYMTRGDSAFAWGSKAEAARAFLRRYGVPQPAEGASATGAASESGPSEGSRW